MSTLIVIDYQEILQGKGKVYVIWWWLIARVIFRNRLREGIFDRKIEIVFFLKDSIVYESLQILARHWHFTTKKRKKKVILSYFNIWGLLLFKALDNCFNCQRLE